MIEYSDTKQLLSYLNEIDQLRRYTEDFIQGENSIVCFCSICQNFKRMNILKLPDQWVDLRSQAVCEGCEQSSRMRLLYETILKETEHHNGEHTKCLLFERVTSFYNILCNRFSDVIGVEYGGSTLTPGDSFTHNGFVIRHEDMQNLSFVNDTFDLIIHSDVLEHVPDPLKGMQEIHRVLRKGGKCIFACPIYSVMNHTKRAYLNQNGTLVFTKGPVFHGDPLNVEGVPVFHEFGLNLLDDMTQIGFEAKFVLNHSIISGYFSNNNPYTVGHMWPIVVVCQR